MFLTLCSILISAALVVVCLLLILVVLMQQPRREGLSPVIGRNVTEWMWGPQTSSVLQKTTVWLAVLLFVLCLALTLVKSAQSRASSGIHFSGESPAEVVPHSPAAIP